MEYKVEPWEHQKEAEKRSLDKDIFALFFEVGTGKSATAINMWRRQCNIVKRFKKTIIFTPPITLKNWKNEWRMHSKIPESKVVVLHGPRKKRLELFDKNKDKPCIFVTNYESLNMEPLMERFIEWEPDALIFDEAHKLKNRQAKRTKLANKLANPRHPKDKKILLKPPLKYILTGTPVLNSPEDLWSQFKILDNGNRLGKNFFVFRARYFVDRNSGMPRHLYFPKWEIKTKEKDGVDGLAEITKKIGDVSMYVKKSECLDLPPLVRKMEHVGMTKEQQRVYNEMKKDFVSYMEGGVVTADLAITKALRLMQITSGFAKTREEKIVEFPDNPKEKRLKELLEELCPGHKVIVWAVWKENYQTIKRICEELGVEAVEIHGGTTDKQKFESVDRFNNDDEVRVLIGHPGSAGIGINLIASDYSVFYSRTFNLEHSLQAEARNYRGGSEIHEQVIRIDLVCDETIDEEVVKRLVNKEKVGEKVLRDISKQI